MSVNLTWSVTQSEPTSSNHRRSPNQDPIFTGWLAKGSCLGRIQLDDTWGRRGMLHVTRFPWTARVRGQPVRWPGIIAWTGLAAYD